MLLAEKVWTSNDNLWIVPVTNNSANRLHRVVMDLVCRGYNSYMHIYRYAHLFTYDISLHRILIIWGISLVNTWAEIHSSNVKFIAHHFIMDSVRWRGKTQQVFFINLTHFKIFLLWGFAWVFPRAWSILMGLWKIVILLLETSNHNPQKMWDEITCPCPQYLLLAHKSLYLCHIYSYI